MAFWPSFVLVIALWTWITPIFCGAFCAHTTGASAVSHQARGKFFDTAIVSLGLLLWSRRWRSYGGFGSGRWSERFRRRRRGRSRPRTRYRLVVQVDDVLGDVHRSRRVHHRRL